MATMSSQEDVYWPITIARSDGRGYQGLDHEALDLNNPQDVAQLERWEVIIAGHLQIQLAPKDDKKQYKLDGFPRGYELRVAVRKEAARDYYLYGHPAGVKAIFRTPGDFALHALWLASNSNANNDCSCDLCPRFVADTLAQRAKEYEEKMQQQQLQSQFPQQAQQVQNQVAQIAPQQQQQQQQQTASTASAVPIHLGTSGVTNVFRVGEMVWYKHAAWRLGIILAITPRPGINITIGASDSSFNFTIAPLGHSILKQEPLVKDAMSMRPFLTFSVPATGFEDLKDMSFEDVNWAEYVARQAAETDPTRRSTLLQGVGLEASKLGARSINDSYSCFNKIYDQPTSDQLYRMQCYNGVYLGAEMILVKDPIRVAPTPSQVTAEPDITNITLVMLVTEIDVLTSRTQANSRPTLQFRGNTYRTIRSPANAPPQNFQQPEAMGPAFVEELTLRNRIEKDKSMRWWWVLVETNTARQENDITGRYYPTEKLATIIHPDRFQNYVASGVCEEPPAYLNTRAQSGMGNGYTGRRAGRAAALADKIGFAFKAPDGMVEDTE
ncbi:transcription-silencing protein Clr2-domain-containing protein [Podospora fimiseda]|uniref:Transcription-silencing protein Clr2-domain-containing protein n=1 Tax=Podospora fimiseda TaxID=252190 RepID=A0AAN7BV15_9PEZI|nr:transcription-silencing protein Clr2-domain-containing protein [Podospora fimiseda]